MLKGKTVVITGASSGLGRAAALEFARNGANVVLAARRLAPLQDAVRECEKFKVEAVALECDVGNASNVEFVAREAVARFGKIDVWINNAGVGAVGEFNQTPIQAHDQVIRTNLMGCVHGAYAVLPYFKAQGFGVIINTNSIGAFVPTPYAAAYCASKFGLLGFSESLKGELSRYPNIHVCDVFPAFMNTPGIDHAANYTGRELLPVPPMFSPFVTARKMVRLALHPKDQVMIGVLAWAARIAYGLFPRLTRSLEARSIEAYLKTAPREQSWSGNLFESPAVGTSPIGREDVMKRRRKRMKTAGAVAVGASLAGAAYLFSKSKMSHSARRNHAI